jgi:acyl-CoA thioesterase-1
MALFNALILVCTLAATPAAGAAAAPRIVALGDSLTAGYGLAPEESFPVRLQEALAAHGVAADVENAGVSGDTTAGGLARVEGVLKRRPDAVIVELGANDALRGLEPKESYANLDAILTQLGEKHIPVLLAGMKAPPNMGREYGTEFDAIYETLAKKHKAALYPFFLDGVASDPALNQNDGIHPNPAGVKIIVERMLPYVLRLVGAPG